MSSHALSFWIIMIAAALPCAAQTEKGPIERNKTIVSQWAQQTNAVRLANAESLLRLDARRAVCRVQAGPDRSYELPVVAFKDARSGKVWLGRELEFYVEDGSRIVGGIVAPAAMVQWLDNLAETNETDLDAAVERFNKETGGSKLLRPFQQVTDLKFILRPEFSRAAELSSETVTPVTEAIAVESGKLKLDLKTLDGGHRASVWIDLKTREVVRAEEDGRQVFPK